MYLLQNPKPLDTGGGGCPTREGGSGQGTQESFTELSFLFPMRDQMRPVINLKRLNNCMKPQHLKMEELATLKESPY